MITIRRIIIYDTATGKDRHSPLKCDRKFEDMREVEAYRKKIKAAAEKRYKGKCTVEFFLNRKVKVHHFFALYKDADGKHLRYVNHIKAMINSIKKNAKSVKSYFIYDGEPDELTAWLEANKVKVIYHESSIKELLKNFAADGYDAKTACGAFLRLEVPAICKKLKLEQDYFNSFLYTDCDVLFLKEPTAIAKNKKDEMVAVETKLFAIAPEFNWRADNPYFNTGVMWINIVEFEKQLPLFIAYLVKNQPQHRFQDYDQLPLNTFFNRKFDILSPLCNWRPYAGVNADAQILHFHGIKEWMIADCIEKDGHENAVLNKLYQANKEGYAHYYKLFNEYLNYKNGN